jgi:Metal-dependent hydrolases of the beta-lactamase superfamily III
MIVTILGSSANQTAMREGTAFLVEDPTGETNVLVDAGPGIVAALGRCNRRASDVSTVLLSHTHGDHISGFAYFVWQRYYERVGAALPATGLLVLGLQNALDLARDFFNRCYNEVKLPFVIEYRALRPDRGVSTCPVGRFALSTCLTRHTTPSIGFRFDLAGKSISISSDTLPSEPFTELSKDVDILFHEGMWTEFYRDLADRAMHSTAKDAAQVAAAANCRQLVLLHVYPELFGRERELLLEASQYFGGPVSIPHDGSVFIA